MKKLLSVLVTLIIVSAVGLCFPYFMGILAQKKCQELAGTFANLARVEITVTDYQRHWFDSDATFVIKLRQPLASTRIGLDKVDAKLQQWTVTAHILHGPIVILPSRIKLAQAVVEAAVILTKEQNALLQRENAVLPLANISLGINLDGSSTLRIDGAPLAYKGEKVSFSLQGMNIQVAFSAFLNNIKSTINLSKVDFVEEDSSLHLDGLMIIYAGTKNDLDLWVGQRQAAFKSLVMKNGSNYNLVLTGLTFNTSVVEERHLVTARSTIALDSLNFNNANYTQNALVWEATNLDVAALVKLQHEIRKLSDMSEPSMQQGMSLVRYFGLLLSNGVTLAVKQVTTHTPWGVLNASGQIDSAKTSSMDFIALLTNLRSEFNLQVEQPLAQYLLTKYYGRDTAGAQVSSEERAKKTLNDLLQSGTIIIEGTSYKVKFKYDKELLVNGKPVSLTTQNQLPLQSK